jgi:hypothetical protein
MIGDGPFRRRGKLSREECLRSLDFARVLDRVAGFLEGRGFPWALIGALGLQAYGLARLSHDLDLVTAREAQEDLLEFLESLGYETLYASEGYSNHLHADAALGRIDFVYVRGETKRLLFAGCRKVRSGLGRDVDVPRPEHLVALKVQAMKNDPRRRLQDMADVQFLLGLPGVDRTEARGYFERAGLLESYLEIERHL